MGVVSKCWDDCKCPGFYTQEQAEADAEFSAEHHVVKGTMLSDAAVLNCCKIILAWQKHRVAIRAALDKHYGGDGNIFIASEIRQILDGEK